MIWKRRRNACLAAILAAAGFGTDASAAVRTCTARLTSIAARDATEQGAKKQAIADWLLKAHAAGIENPAWRLAAERRLICQSVPGTGQAAQTVFECIAVGHACSVLQNPNQSLPQPAAPAAKARGLET